MLPGVVERSLFVVHSLRRENVKPKINDLYQNLGCQSSWTRQLELNSAKGKVEMTHTADTLERQLQHGSLFGGDLRSILNIVSSTLLKIKAETDHDALATDLRDDQVKWKTININ